MQQFLRQLNTLWRLQVPVLGLNAQQIASPIISTMQELLWELTYQQALVDLLPCQQHIALALWRRQL